LFDQIFNVLANPLILLLISFPVLIFVGIYVDVWLTHPRKHRVLQIEPETSRAIDFQVESEDTVNAYCKPVANSPPQRFIKLHNALNVVRKGPFRLQNYAMWLARLGTAYTTQTGEKKTDVKISLRQAIQNLFGKELYDRIPNNEKTGFIKDRIERSEVGVTVELPASNPLTPTGFESLSSDDLRRADIDSFIGALVRGVKSQFKGIGGDYLKTVFILGTGVGIGIVLSLVFKWGAPTVLPPAGG